MVWDIIFYLTSAIALVTSGALIFVRQPMHGAVYLIASLLALAVIYYLLGSAFIAALQVMLYIGAIMVLYVFFIMLSPVASSDSSRPPLLLPALLIIILLAEFVLLMNSSLPLESAPTAISMMDPKELGLALFGHYKIAIEATSALLLAALAGVMYLARKLKAEGAAK